MEIGDEVILDLACRLLPLLQEKGYATSRELHTTGAALNNEIRLRKMLKRIGHSGEILVIGKFMPEYGNTYVVFDSKKIR